MKLSDNFTLEEMIVSKEHPDLAAQIQPTPDQIRSLFLLCQLGLEKIREEWGRTVITSGLRSPELNAACGGVDSSQHLLGEAADFLCPMVSDMFQVYIWCHDQLQWPGQLGFYRKRGHCHIALPNINVKPNFWVSDDK